MKNTCAFLVCFLNAVAAITVSMKGTQHFRYIMENPVTNKIMLVFRFKTVEPSGLLFYASSYRVESFMCLELINGALRFTSKTVTFGELFEQRMIVGNNLNTFEWHRVNVTRNGANVAIEIDDNKYAESFQGSRVRLQLVGSIYLGGVDSNVDLSQERLTNRKFSGCLQGFMFNGIDMLYQAKYSKKGFKTCGDVIWDTCEHIDYDPVMFRSVQDHALIPTNIKHTDSLNVVLNFRTFFKNGLIFTKHSNALKVFLALKDGVLTLEVDISESTYNPLVLRLGQGLADGFWHRAEFLVHARDLKAELQIDKTKDSLSLNGKDPVVFDVNNGSLAGGYEEKLGGFIGCIYGIWVNDNPIEYKNLPSDYSFGLIKGCDIKDHCLFTPCQHGGACSQDVDSFTCDCTFIHYHGDRCQHSMFQRGCQAYKDIGVTEDSYCTIDPDGDEGNVEPFQVVCNMTSHPTNALTILRHDHVNTSIPVSIGKRVGNMIKTTLDYGVPRNAIKSLFSTAVSCEQFIQFKCFKSLLLNTPLGPSKVKWESRDGEMQDYWGGATPASRMCACGMNGSCAGIYELCNCDVNDNHWREDSGMLTEIDHLPVMSIYSYLSSNQSIFVVGRLVCRFAPNITDHPEVSKRQYMTACTPVVPKPTRKPVFVTVRTPRWIGREITPTKRVTGMQTQRTKKKVEIVEKSGNNIDGLSLQLNNLTIALITGMVVIVAIVIGVVCAIKKRQGRNQRKRDYEDEEGERTEMCTLFRAVADRNRPVIEVHKHSRHCDGLDKLPPIPLRTHIELSYQPRRRGIFC